VAEAIKRIFIDGEAGTTGLRIFERLRERESIRIIRLAPEHRKDRAARADALNSCDLAVLCLPDEASIEAVSLITNPQVRVLDASTAYRTDPDWTYGFSEMTAGQGERISKAFRVTNPGCYATGAIALVRPLVEAGILPHGHAVTINAVSGYTGGGKSLIAAFEDPAAPNRIDSASYEYGLGLQHKHVPEIRTHGMLAHDPLFVPSVGRFPQGMLVNLPLPLWSLAPDTDGERLHEIYREHYRGAAQVRVRDLRTPEGGASADRLEAEALADSDLLDVHVYWNARNRQALAVASLDNLGKGACGAAIQNIELMLGVSGLAERA
jgi:N-acetyl-gamma-glutamyl-phosphate reductase